MKTASSTGAPNSAVIRASRWRRYGPDDLQREYHRVKGCAPLCTVGCVHRVAQVDELREDPQAALSQWFASPVPGQPPRFPLPVKVLMWASSRVPDGVCFARRSRVRPVVIGAERRGA